MNRFHIQLLMFILLIWTTQGVYTQSEVNITVWVHGTYPALKLLRSSHSPFRSWVYVPYGLSLAKELPDHYYFNKLARGCCQYDSPAYDIDHFYLYGWYSSNMRPKQRKAEGQKLYDCINNLIKRYQAEYECINIRFVGFSHGGNVILHCISHLPFVDQFVRPEVILIATPVQESTRSYINNPYIKKAYSVYSNADWIQRIDIQKLHSDAPKKVSFWSNRVFEEDDNVYQIHLKVNGKEIGHGQYRSIVYRIPDMIQQVLQNPMYEDYTDHFLLNYKL